MGTMLGKATRHFRDLEIYCKKQNKNKDNNKNTWVTHGEGE